MHTEESARLHLWIIVGDEEKDHAEPDDQNACKGSDKLDDTEIQLWDLAPSVGKHDIDEVCEYINLERVLEERKVHGDDITDGSVVPIYTNVCKTKELSEVQSRQIESVPIFEIELRENSSFIILLKYEHSIIMSDGWNWHSWRVPLGGRRKGLRFCIAGGDNDDEGWSPWRRGG